jgi:nucleoid-associated protein YgaU
MDRLEELKNKYATVIGAMKLGGVRVDNLDVRENRLFIRGAAPTDDIKNSIWDQIKDVDPKFGDLNFDLSVDPKLPALIQTYVVKAGDSLWAIAQKFYGNGGLFQRIISANPNKLKDEKSVIHPGDKLLIPV